MTRDDVDIDAVRARVEDLEASLESLKQLLDAGDTTELKPKYRVLRDVYRAGGIVSRDRWQEIGREHGYDDARGLAGLFAHGKWVEKIMDDQVALTDYAAEKLQETGIVEAD